MEMLRTCPVSMHLRSSGSNFNKTKTFAVRQSLCTPSQRVLNTKTRYSGSARRSLRVRAAAEDEKNKASSTLGALDSLLGIEEEEVVETPRAPPTPTPTPEATKPQDPAPVKKSPEGEKERDISEKVIGSVTYLLPMMDGLKFGKFLFAQFPVIGLLFAPLQPVIRLYYQLGFFNIIIFFGIYFGLARNNEVSKYLRFNASQAVLLDIVLILPEIFTSLFNGINGPPSGGAGLEFQIIFYNTVFWIVYLSSSYGVIQCLRGKEPRIPFLGDAADMQSGPEDM